MYVPTFVSENDQDTLHDFIEHYSFSTVVSADDGEPVASHLPILLDRSHHENAGQHRSGLESKVFGCAASFSRARSVSRVLTSHEYRALKPNGRLVAEFGGKGNVRHLVEAIETACQAVLGETVTHRWYFPSIAEFATVLEQHGLGETQAALIDRPTPLEGDDGLRNWVRMFGNHWLSRISQDRQSDFFQHVEDVARSTLLRESVWHADYRRLRIVANKSDER